jgi:hypothetical protein
VERNERLADAIAHFERRLAKEGPFVFDPKGETQRNRAIRRCLAGERRRPRCGRGDAV